MIRKNLYFYKRQIFKVYYSLLNLYSFRFSISFLRAFVFIKIFRKLKTFEIEEKRNVHEPTIFTNLRRVINNKKNPHPTSKYFLGIDMEHGGDKVRLLFNPIMSIDHIKKDIDHKKVLVIGPRVESEILSVMSYGIPKTNITAIDLISYSPWVDLGDMHNLPYEDNLFDIIICGWVIAYSNKKDVAAKEMVRVSKNGAVIAIGVTYSPVSNEEVIRDRGYLVGSPERLISTNQINDLFLTNLDKVYFANDANDLNKNSKLVSVFSINK